MWKAILILGCAMTFESYLAARHNPVELIPAYGNPYADTLARDLDAHLKTIRAWLNGTINTEKMRAAMDWFSTVFEGQYEVKPGTKLYRGQDTKLTDGTPRSYSTEKWIAGSFACEPGGGPFAKIFATHPKSYLISRKVCKACADSGAFKTSLDLAKVLSDYGMGQHKYSVESEVVILNTQPRGKTASMVEINCEREAIA
jgi:hypothetical protein